MTRMNTSAKTWILPAEKLPTFLAALAEHGELWIPSPMGEGVRYLPYGEDLTVDLTQTPPAHAVKAILFPNPETLFTYQREKNDLSLETPPSESRPLVAFGVRACDVHAILALDAVFLKRGVPDPSYQDRRKRLCLIGLACPDPAPTCFCDRMGGGPFDPAGMDIQIVPLEGRFAFRILTERGKEILTPLQNHFGKATESHRNDIAAAAKAAVKNPAPPVDFAALKEAVKAGRDDPFWISLADACLGCGICTFLCPVCSCFSITDTGNLRNGRRIRHWDACLFPAFTKEASGHNPRGSVLDRVKQRFFHKFYYSIENDEPPGCVGCGRCVVQCPAAIDIREIVRYFQPEATS